MVVSTQSSLAKKILLHTLNLTLFIVVYWCVHNDKKKKRLRELFTLKTATKM